MKVSDYLGKIDNNFSGRKLEPMKHEGNFNIIQERFQASHIYD